MNANQTHTLPAVALLLDGCRGTYIPRDFVTGYNLESWDLHESMFAVKQCMNPDGDCYWDCWDVIMDKAVFVEDGYVWRLYQDGDLWALCPELMSSDELESFGFDREMVEERRLQESADAE